MSWDDWQWQWQWQLLRVVAIWGAAWMAYYVCWVRYPPAPAPRKAPPFDVDDAPEEEDDPLTLPRWGSPRLRWPHS